jgi:two-component system OmpR family sensor kinase
MRRTFQATLGVKLALVMFAIVAGALGIVYLLVVPQLEQRLVDEKVRELKVAAEPVVRALRPRLGVVEVQDVVAFSGQNLNARVVVYRPLDERHLLPVADSSPVDAGAIEEDPIALEAAETGFTETGRVERQGDDWAEVARPFGGRILLISAPLDDALSTVGLVRRSVLVAGLVALLAAAAVAYAAALGLTGRLRRLERAAERIAAGNFRAPVDTSGSDEVAELARGFDSMRLRLADLDRVRREFIANASHELRTPLFTLGGFLELLADEDLDPETRREFIRETRAQVVRLTRLATDLLDLSRLDAGQLQVERRDVDLAAAARSVAEEFRPIAEADGHRLSVDAPEPVHALADEQRVAQIARILVENAIRHTPAGTPVAVSAVQRDGRAELVVRDEGPGIAADEQDRLFTRFYRAGGGKASGSGLGLAIASELAKLMDGAIELRSQTGESVFTLRLPASASFPRENEPEVVATTL